MKPQTMIPRFTFQVMKTKMPNDQGGCRPLMAAKNHNTASREEKPSDQNAKE